MSHMANASLLVSSTSEIKHFIYEFRIEAPFGAPFHKNYFFELQLYQKKIGNQIRYKGKAKEENFDIHFKWIELTKELDSSLELMKKIIRRELGFVENSQERDIVMKEKEAVLNAVRDFQSEDEWLSESLPFPIESFENEGFEDSLRDKSKVIERNELVHGLECCGKIYYFDLKTNSVTYVSDVDKVRASNFDKTTQESGASYVAEAERLNLEYWKEHSKYNPGDM